MQRRGRMHAAVRMQTHARTHSHTHTQCDVKYINN